MHPETQPPRKVAIVHDWLPVYGGAERVLEQIIALYPTADVYTMVDLLSPEQRRFLKGRKVTTSFIQSLPEWMRRQYRAFLPLMACTVEQFDLAQYDLVVSSSYAVAKGVITGPNQLHVCYCHSPMRYAWDLQQQYLRESNLESNVKGLIARIFLHYLRIWDTASQQRVDHFITNSQFVRQRIKKLYRRDAHVIYPPVDVDAFAFQETKGDYYFTASRLVPYKMVGLIVAAFAKMPDRKLRVIGDGPEFKRIARMATPNIEMLGYQSNERMREEMQGAKAFVFAAEEDFGIVVVEAQACGTPVIAYGKGGARETVIPDVTGKLFPEQTVESLCAGVEQFEKAKFDPVAIREHAQRFSIPRFRSEMQNLLDRWWAEGAENSDFSSWH